MFDAKSLLDQLVGSGVAGGFAGGLAGGALATALSGRKAQKVAGSALRWGEVDTLVMASGYQPDPGWTCTACRAIGTETPETSVCPECGKPSTRPTDVREALLRLAGQSECLVEVVEQSDALMNLGGVGCLLRYQADFRKEKAGGFAQALSMEKA
jgi:hypothetical protein